MTRDEAFSKAVDQLHVASANVDSQNTCSNALQIADRWMTFGIVLGEMEDRGQTVHKA